MGRLIAAGATAGGLVVALSACSGSSAPAGPPDLGTAPATLPVVASSPVPVATALAASCEHPDDTVRTALAAQLASNVEVRQAAELQTKASLNGQPVVYLAGVVYRDGNRVGTAVWASANPSQPGGWTAVDAGALQASHVMSAAGTAAELSKNVADYSHVSGCATLGF